ncbi:MAG TPA: M23 family metallopeptidase [Lysobacter sp.]
MGKAVLLFLVIVLAGANLALYRYGRDRPTMAPTAEAREPAATRATVASSPASSTALGASGSKADSSAGAPTATPSSGSPVAQTVPDGADARLLVPVEGITATQLDDTFSDARAQGRVHEAIDIMAPRGTPVLAVADGNVEKLFNSVPGGLTIYQFEPSGRYAYYYAHLDRYADGLHEKQAIRRGEVIGYVGSTGNADPSAPHLHFAIFELGPERQWWKGTAINPYPFLTVPPLAPEHALR